MQKRSRVWISGAIGFVLVVGLAYAFWPRAVLVDMGQVVRAPMQLTINEEARTRVRDAYLVSAPVSGRLLRVGVDPGALVELGKTIVARMLPANPPALDRRTREQAVASRDAAKAALGVAQAAYNKAQADKSLADLELKRARVLHEKGTIAEAALDHAKQAARAAQAARDTAKASIAMREADLANAHALLMSFDDNDHDADPIPLYAPVSGRVLRVIQESETTLAAGMPIMEIGDIENDLEIIAELLSTDAVRVSVGNPVIITNWGGAAPLQGVVERVEPWGFTKYSALGVEEQRVNTIVRFAGDDKARRALGHGFRVEVQIVVWQDEAALTVPSSALMRNSQSGVEGWAVFLNDNGRARLRPVDVGRNNGLVAEVKSGLEEGDTVVLFPTPELVDGTAIDKRLVD